MTQSNYSPLAGSPTRAAPSPSEARLAPAVKEAAKPEALQLIRTTFERFELKYWVDERQARQILAFAEPYLRRDPHDIAGAVRRDLEAYVRDQGVPPAVVTLTPDEFARMLLREFGVNAVAWAGVQARARYGPQDGRAYDAAHRSRTEARKVKRELRKSLAFTERARGAVQVRSLLP